MDIKTLEQLQKEARVRFGDMITKGAHVYLADIIAQSYEAGRTQAEQEFKKIFNSGKRMYELGRKDEREEILHNLQEQSLPYDGARWGNQLTIDTIKRVINARNEK